MSGVRHASRSGGFSLLELMVALTVGGIAITSIYAVGSASSRHFQEQQRVASTQAALRMAMDQVKRDVARAGYLGTANAAVDRLCEPLNPNYASNGTNFAGFALFQDNVGIVAGTNDAIDPTKPNNTNNGFSADTVVLMGNYDTNSEYSGISAQDSDSIGLQRQWYAFRRDFTQWPVGRPDLLDIPVFQQAFIPGRAVRIQTGSRRRFFSTIDTVAPGLAGSPNDVQINLNDDLGGCMPDVSGGWIAPVTTLRYFVRNAGGLEAERFTGTEGLVGVLLRQEVSPVGAKNVVLPGGTTRTVLDHVVSFNLDFTFNTANLPEQADVYDPGTWGTPATVGTNPEFVRAVRITLAARTPKLDPRFPWTQTGCTNMRCFQVFAGQGAARVRWLQTEVFVPNIAVEGY